MRKRGSPRRDRREIDKTTSLPFLQSQRGRLIGSVEPIPREIINARCYVKKMMERFMRDAESTRAVVRACDSLTRVLRDVLIYNTKGIS